MLNSKADAVEPSPAGPKRAVLTRSALVMIAIRCWKYSEASCTSFSTLTTKIWLVIEAANLSQLQTTY